VEIVRRGASYSIDTVREFSAVAASDDLYLILGLDAFSLVGSWKDWRELLALTHVIVTSRPGFGDELCYEGLPVVVREAFCYDSVRSGFRNNLGKEILFKRLSDVFVSASEIRELLRKGKSIHDLTPVQVQRYVEDQQLYSELPEP
jgi:nicotinate-nucleotide adenylyltransferase